MEIVSIFAQKKAITGTWVAIMDHERDDRSLQINPHKTRCILEKEIHEFLICDQSTNILAPINHIAYLGFGEFTIGGVIETGDSLYSDTELIGKIVGFDETHFPNHYNIIVQGSNCASGACRQLPLNGVFTVRKSDF